MALALRESSDDTKAAIPFEPEHLKSLPVLPVCWMGLVEGQALRLAMFDSVSLLLDHICNFDRKQAQDQPLFLFASEFADLDVTNCGVFVYASGDGFFVCCDEVFDLCSCHLFVSLFCVCVSDYMSNYS
jgi:hypothetical protein